MQAMTAAVDMSTHTHSDEYNRYLSRIREKFTAATSGGEPVFTTDADPSEIWDSYLNSFEPERRQYHNCSACRRFIKSYGAVVTIDAHYGYMRSPLWDDGDAPKEYASAVKAILTVVRRAKVTGVLLVKHPELGLAVTGEWTHFSVTAPSHVVNASKLLTANQRMAEKRQEFENVRSAVAEVRSDTLSKAAALLRSDALYRGDKVLRSAEWLLDLKASARGACRDHVIWRAVASAPSGFTHPRGSVLWTLIEDIESGTPLDDVKRKFSAKMSPLLYQRPQAAPTVGNIQRAEEIVSQLGIARSLERRFATVDECVSIWKPSGLNSAVETSQVFGHLVPKGSVPDSGSLIRDEPITWSRFSQEVLPNATRLQVLIPYHGAFVGITTATHGDAPPILRWDHEGARNPCSWYQYIGGSTCHRWGLSSGWTDVTALCLHPSAWVTGSHQIAVKDALVAILPGACDTRCNQLGLFPETLREELREVRSVIEAYSQRGSVQPISNAACGLQLPGARVRATVDGITVEYNIDRWH